MAGDTFAGDIVFGPEKRTALSEVEQAIQARGYRVTRSRRAEFESFILAQLEGHFYRAYGEANKTKSHGGANLAERAPLFPDEVADVIRAHWRQTYWSPSRVRSFARSLMGRLTSMRLVELNRAPAPQPSEEFGPARLRSVCGFFPPSGGVVVQRDVATVVGTLTQNELTPWRSATGTVLTEVLVDQFSHLVRYWLGAVNGIQPSTLKYLQARAVSGTINYAPLLVAGAAPAVVAAAARAVRAALLAGAPAAGGAANLDTLVGNALNMARRSRTGPERNRAAWSAVFVSDCVRRAAISLGLESDTGGTHLGRMALLRGSPRHAEYVHEAHRRRFAVGVNEGGYHAFRPDEHPVQVGDIIVLDRRARRLQDVYRFDAIPQLRARALHGDIVVGIAAGYAVTIGGNLGGSVRRRHYPLDAQNRVVIAREQRYTQESDGGTLPPLPDVDPGGRLHIRSTARIFAVLNLVAICVTVPGQSIDGTYLV